MALDIHAKIRRPSQLVSYKPRSKNTGVRLTAQGCSRKNVREVFLSCIFNVPRKNSDRCRFILDLSELTVYIQTFRLRMLTITQVWMSLHQGDWWTCLALSEVYWRVPIYPRFHSFPSFQVGSETYQFTRIPFGLSIAPRVHCPPG